MLPFYAVSYIQDDGSDVDKLSEAENWPSHARRKKTKGNGVFCIIFFFLKTAQSTLLKLSLHFKLICLIAGSSEGHTWWTWSSQGFSSSSQVKNSIAFDIMVHTLFSFVA